MFGWINDCTESLIISQFGESTWHEIKQKAKCDIPDGGFLRYKYYADADTVALVVAASEVLGISVDDVLYTFGEYFLDYVEENGYANVLKCLGSNLRDWLSNLNSLHDHLQASYPEGFVAPVFWSEDDVEYERSMSGANSNAILVNYFSHRGNLLVPLVVGLINKLARVYFGIEIIMTQQQLQDEAKGIGHTTWRVTTKDPSESYKLRGKRAKPPKMKGEKRDDETLATADSTYEKTFREVGTRALNLRVDEFVKRSFKNKASDLFHALTLEQYLVLTDYWKKNQINGKWCFQIWSMQDNDPLTWVSLHDLPAMLNPKTISPLHFGGKVPETGKFPPDEFGNLQSFPPRVQILNSVTAKSIDLEVPKSTEVSIQHAIYCAKEVQKEGITDFPELQNLIDDNKLEIQVVLWNDQTNDAYHTFALDDLPTVSTQQLFDLVPVFFDPIKLVVQCKEALVVDSDEEDI